MPGSVVACSWPTGRLFFLYTGRDLIGLIIDLALTENQALARTPGRDYMDRTLAAGPVKRVPKRLAVHRHYPATSANGWRSPKPRILCRSRQSGADFASIHATAVLT